MTEVFQDFGLLIVPWILIIFIAAIFMRGLDWFFEATRMRNIKHKKKMLAWMAGAAALFCLVLCKQGSNLALQPKHRNLTALRWERDRWRRKREWNA
jgi:hypothetical protein